jgi:hypothetical protein
MLEKVELVISGQFRETCNIGHKIKNNKIKNQITDKQNKELTVENGVEPRCWRSESRSCSL